MIVFFNVLCWKRQQYYDTTIFQKVRDMNSVINQFYY